MGNADCPGCRELTKRVAELEAIIRDLLARLGSNASNSSLPPSANPPGAAKPVTKKPTGRKPGGQPGHPAQLRRLLPPEQVRKTVRLIPKECQRCQTPLPKEASPGDPPPTRHQIAELPKMTARIREYQGHSRTCPGCGHVNHRAIPARLRARCCGTRLTATIAYFTGCHHLSKRATEELVENLFGVPIALGSVTALEQEVSAALAPAHAEALEAVRQAPVKHVDETSWKQAGKKRWLWVAATARVAAFVIHGKRGIDGLVALLGIAVRGILCSDRWSVYHQWPVQKRQICWAHLKRDFQKCKDRGGPGASIGDEGLGIVAKIFKAWHLFRGGGCDRNSLQRRLSPVARHLHQVLERGCRCADSKVANFCVNLLALEPALWQFVVSDQVEPTNNHAERVLRRGVLWRRVAFGCHSAEGCHFVERILTVVQTLRLQQHNVLDFLYQTLHAHRSKLPVPKLLSFHG